jgi:anthranilate synthase component 1
MTVPSEKDYRALAREFDVVPVYREVLADMETPVSVLARFQDAPNLFLLESVEGGETWGRYSFVGVDPEIFLDAPHGVGAPSSLEALRSVFHGLRVAELPGLPRFCGGVVGYLGYEAAGEFERLPPPRAARGGPAPHSRFLKADRLIVFDNVRHTMKLVVCTRPRAAGDPLAEFRRAEREIEALARRLAEPFAPAPTARRPPPRFASNLSREAFTAAVRRARDYIFAGDAIQVVLSRRFTADCDLPPLAVYRALRYLNPSPYLFFLKTGDQTLAGSSPEVMVRLTGGKVELRPIAGTRPRGATEQEDRRLADELLADEKERAEHVMLVDLGRNDVGRVCDPGSVQVTDFMVIERYSHVMHIVSHVEGLLRKGLDAFDVLRSAFPAGTLTGAPKIRAMQIIHELEPEPRGVYGGAVGYIGYDGNMDMAITIRTLEMRGGRVAVQAGAGLVFDSDPDREFEETDHKSRGMRAAVALAAAGLENPGAEGGGAA